MKNANLIIRQLRENMETSVHRFPTTYCLLNNLILLRIK